MNINFLLSRPLEDDTYSDAAVVLFFTSRSFLLIKRRPWNEDPWSGQMALPGGHRKPWETALQAAVREAEEEVGITPNISGSLGIFSPHSRPMKVRVFLSHVKEELPFKVGPEVLWAAWAREDDLVKGEDCFYFKGERVWGMTYRILLAALGTSPASMGNL
jgi:8-oxo-dGTP pyrophosphatase MutT (NUDIX family)